MLTAPSSSSVPRRQAHRRHGLRVLPQQQQHTWHQLPKLHCSKPRPRITSSAATTAGQSLSLDGLDFYAILGVSYTAQPREIRAAYHSLMKDLHPDRLASLSGPASLAEATTDLCALLNEIYEVLGDEDKRATYDALSGFSATGTNPFLDTSFVRDQVFVDEVSCIGCGKCVRWASGTFEIEASKYGRARVIDQGGDSEEDVLVAIETCPVDCIHWVTLPQLSLLEAALATMGRIDVFVMQRTQRSAGNVFQEAFKAWENRRLVIAAAAAAAAGQPRSKVDWTFWGTGSLEREQESQQQAPKDPAQRRIANLAAAAARAARMWRAYLQSRSVLRSLSDGSGDE